MLNEMHVSYHKKVLNDKSWLFLDTSLVFTKTHYTPVSLLCHAEYEFQVKIKIATKYWGTLYNLRKKFIEK